MKQIVQLLRSQILPLTDSLRETRIVVARTMMRSADLPDGVTMTHRKVIGKRVVTKNKRRYGNRRYYIAEWPEANLQELAVPKIACVVDGTADYLLGNSCVHCVPGTFILMPSLIPHQRNAPYLQGERLRNGSCVLLHALAHKDGLLFWYSRSINERHINEYSDNYLIPSISAAHILRLLIDEAAEEKLHFESVASGLISSFFATIAREIEAGNCMHPGPKENVSAPAITVSFSEQIQEYVDTHCHRALRLEAVAAHMYMSRSQFALRMKRETGITFVELLTRVRIEQACKLLRETDLTFKAIASCLSFKSSTYFRSLFHSRMGCTPMEYRSQNVPKY